jgi:hypothetical protein
MFSIRAAKTCQKFEIPHAWSASMWLKSLNGWNSAVSTILPTSYILVVLAVIVRTPKLEHDMFCQDYCSWKLKTRHQKYNYPICECCHRELKCTFSYQSW